MSSADADLLFNWLSEQDDVAFLWHAVGDRETNSEKDSMVDALIASAPRDDFGMRIRTPEDQEKLSALLLSKNWQAYFNLKCKGNGRYTLWHMPSGPILIDNHGKSKDPYIHVKDPYNGWSGASVAGESDIPLVNFEPRFLLLNLELSSHKDGVLATNISNPSSDWEKEPKQFRLFWSRFKRFINKNTTNCRVDVEGYSKNMEFRVWPNAKKLIV
ncbi:MAG: hypothetical protein R3E90_09930 [Marinicella sp.]